MPLRKDHWIYGDPSCENEGFEYPPMPLRMGAKDFVSMVIDKQTLTENTRHLFLDRNQMADVIRRAGKYAVRAATMKGKDMDFDPDALLQNLVVGLLGYWTEDGLSSDDWGNPPNVS